MNRNRGSIMKEGDPKLANNWSFLARGRRHNFFPDLPDKDLPYLSTSPEATTSEDHLRLGVSFAVLGWICMIPFKGGGAFLPKRTTGASGENQKTDPLSFLGSGPSSCCRKRKWDQKDSEVKGRKQWANSNTSPSGISYSV
jgi:hypothetical protein